MGGSNSRIFCSEVSMGCPIYRLNIPWPWHPFPGKDSLIREQGKHHPTFSIPPCKIMLHSSARDKEEIPRSRREGGLHVWEIKQPTIVPPKDCNGIKPTPCRVTIFVVVSISIESHCLADEMSVDVLKAPILVMVVMDLLPHLLTLLGELRGNVLSVYIELVMERCACLVEG